MAGSRSAREVFPFVSPLELLFNKKLKEEEVSRASMAEPLSGGPQNPSPFPVLPPAQLSSAAVSAASVKPEQSFKNSLTQFNCLLNPLNYRY